MSVDKLPSSWAIQHLENIAIWGSGGTPLSTNPEYYGGGIPWLVIGDLNDGYITKSEKTITQIGLENSSAKIVEPESILVAMYGSIGKLGINKIPLATNQAIAFTKKIHYSVSNHYLFHYLFYIRQKLNSLGKGGTQKNISQTVLKNVEIPLPPLPEQHRIVAKIEELFSELDKAIESLKTAQQQLKVYRQSVLKHAFEGKFTNPEVKDGDLPEGWALYKISALCDVNPKLPDSDLSDDFEVTFLPMKNVFELINKINTSEIRKYSHVKKGFTPMIDGDVIFAKITPCMENGKIAVVESLKNGVGFGSTEFHVLRCRANVNNTYIFYFLVQEITRRSAEEHMVGAVGQRRVPKKFLEDLLIPMPVNKEGQISVVEKIQAKVNVCDIIEKSIENGFKGIQALKQSILKSAFEGKLVPQDPNDEPASVLLERIKAERSNTEQVKKTRAKKITA